MPQLFKAMDKLDRGHRKDRAKVDDKHLVIDECCQTFPGYVRFRCGIIELLLRLMRRISWSEYSCSKTFGSL